MIDHRQPLEEGLKAIGIPKVRYVAGLTATERHQKSIVEVLAPQGALALIDDPETFDIVPFKTKSLSVHWEFMFTRGLYRTPNMAEQHRILRHDYFELFFLEGQGEHFNDFQVYLIGETIDRLR